MPLRGAPWPDADPPPKRPAFVGPFNESVVVKARAANFAYVSDGADHVLRFAWAIVKQE